MTSNGLTNPTDVQKADKQPYSKKKWLFRLVAILIGLSPFVAIEGLCIAFDWGRPSLHGDPFVEFQSVQPLFVLNEDRSRYEIPKTRQAYFRPQTFSAQKPDSQFRIFCLGGSTVQGRPFAVETSFTSWLKLSLQAADPSREWEVINCGGVSYASYRLVPILKEVLNYKPDLIILYTGHNEFLEDRLFDHIKNRSHLLNAMLSTGLQLRSARICRESYFRFQGRSSSTPPTGRPILPTEVEALLDYRGGLEAYHRDESCRQNVIEQYRFNITRMVQMAQKAKVAIMLVNPVSNLRESPPFKSEHRADLSTEELNKWESVYQSAAKHLQKNNYDLDQATQLFDQSCEIDPLYAGSFYSLAKCHDAAGEIDQARAAYLQAKELDVCPLRILQPMNETAIKVAHKFSIPLIDAQNLFQSKSNDGIVGGDWLVDHVHPSIEGHKLLANALIEKLIELKTVTPQTDWKNRKQELWKSHFKSLDNLYFLKGMERLKALKSWAQGRSDKLRDPEKL